jgi:NAD(P)-dependent dehydrogenase (short-subunit alcohol dehydrogenase family)
MTDLSDKTAVVVGASRGLGRGVATAFAEVGATVVGVARDADALGALAGAGIQPEAGDATDPELASTVIERHDPDLLVVVAGATPSMGPLSQQTWAGLSVNWETDVRIAFEWLRAALVKPLRPGGRVVVFSSGAVLQGSPLSGGYAGAKATQRYLTQYAQVEADGRGLGLTFTTVLPKLTPATDLGRVGVAAYAAKAGLSPEDFVAQMGGVPLTPEATGAAVVDLVLADPATSSPAYLLTGEGVRPAP